MWKLRCVGVAVCKSCGVWGCSVWGLWFVGVGESRSVEIAVCGGCGVLGKQVGIVDHDDIIFFD